MPMFQRAAAIFLFVQLVAVGSADTPAYRPSTSAPPPVPKIRTTYEAEACAPFDAMLTLARSGRTARGRPLFGNIFNATAIDPPLFSKLNTCKAYANSEGGYSVSCSQVSENADWPGQFQAYRGGTIKMCYPDWLRNEIGRHVSFISPDRALRLSIHLPDSKYYGNMVETTAAHEPNAVNNPISLR